MPRRMSGCDSRQPHQFVRMRLISHFKAFRISISRAPARAVESPKFRMPGAAPGRLANFEWGRGRQVMHLPCKQAHAGALPADSTNFNCGENEI